MHGDDPIPFVPGLYSGVAEDFEASVQDGKLQLKAKLSYLVDQKQQVCGRGYLAAMYVRWEVCWWSSCILVVQQKGR